MFAPSLNLDLSKLAQSEEEKPATAKKVAAKGAKARKDTAAARPAKKS